MNRDPEGNVWPAAHRRAGPPRCRSDCLSDLLLGVKTDCSSTQRPLCFNTDAIGGAAQPTPHSVTLTTQSRQVGWWKHWTNNSLCWKSLLPVCVRDRWLNKTEDVSAVPVAVPEGTFYRFCLRTEQNRTWRLKKQKQKNKTKTKTAPVIDSTGHCVQNPQPLCHCKHGRWQRHKRHIFITSSSSSSSSSPVTSYFLHWFLESGLFNINISIVCLFFFLWLQWKLQTFCTRSR